MKLCHFHPIYKHIYYFLNTITIFTFRVDNKDHCRHFYKIHVYKLKSGFFIIK